MKLEDVVYFLDENIKSIRATRDYEQTKFNTKQECLNNEINRLEQIKYEIEKHIVHK
jgi:hypothetical protein